VEAVVADVPLVARAPDGWCSLHPLWQDHLAGEVSDADATDACRRAAAVQRERGNYVRAVSMLASAAAWPEALADMADGCGTSTPFVPVDVLEGWAALVPDSRREQPEFHLLAGTIAEAREPLRAAPALEAAVAGFRERGNVDAEVVAIAHLGQVALLLEDPALMAPYLPRVFELEHQGLAMAKTLACLARALIADFAGGHDIVLDELAHVPVDAIDDRWLAIVEWLRANQLLDLGHPEQAEPVIRRAAERVVWAAPVMVQRQAQWLIGDIDIVVAESRALVVAIAESGLAHYVAFAAASAARAHAFVGSLPEATEFLEQARAATLGAQPPALIGLAIAEAACGVAVGDEERAARVLHAELAARPLQPGRLSRPHRQALPLSYLLVPEVRRYWDCAALPPYYETARELARALLAMRDTGSVEAARGLEWPGAGRVRAVLPAPWAVELAVGLAEAGRLEGRELIAAVGPSARGYLRALGSPSQQPLARVARRLLAELPAAPGHRVEVRVLGPLEVHLDGEAVQGELRRERVRALLSFLVTRRVTTRERAAAALWPDHDETAAANNLRVTLSYLLRVLEPGRAEGEPSFFVGQDQGGLRLAVDDALRVDAWECERLLDEAADAEAKGAPSRALDAYQEALALVRGEYLDDVRDQEWAIPEQDRLRTRLVAAAVRAGELLAAAGQVSDAREMAERALGMEPWSEPAYRVLAAAHLAAGDRAAARRTLGRCRSMLDELGAKPEPATEAVERAVAAGVAP
jgi:DNA-binding SARP family transcriptional activator